MSKRRFTAEQIIPTLRDAELELAKGHTVTAAFQSLAVTERHYRWRKEHGGLRSDLAKRLKELEWENALPSLSRRPLVNKSQRLTASWGEWKRQRLWQPRPRVNHRHQTGVDSGVAMCANFCRRRFDSPWPNRNPGFWYEQCSQSVANTTDTGARGE